MSQASGPWTVRRVLEWTTSFFTRKGVDSPRLSAELILSHVLGLPRIRLYTNYEQTLDPRHLEASRALVQRAGEHEPIAYLTGRAHFFNLEFAVRPGVLIPRPDTETLVEQVIQLCRHQAGLESPRILELCTGSGCIAAAVATGLKAASVLAIDSSPLAVEVARQNIEALGLAARVTIEQGDLFAPLEGKADALPFDLILANPPYIPSAAIAGLDRNVRDYEPREALDGGPDGLAVHRRILAAAPQRLVPGGRVLLEIGFDQGPAARELAAQQSGLEDARIVKDYAGHDRVLIARRSS